TSCSYRQSSGLRNRAATDCAEWSHAKGFERRHNGDAGRHGDVLHFNYFCIVRFTFPIDDLHSKIRGKVLRDILECVVYPAWNIDRKSTRLNSSHVKISY